MAGPARRRLRPARRSGLSSPAPVRTRLGRMATPNPIPQPGTRTSRRTGERQDVCAPINLENSSCRNRTGTIYPNGPVDRG